MRSLSTGFAFFLIALAAFGQANNGRLLEPSRIPPAR